jgi:hypothetical protein
MRLIAAPAVWLLAVLLVAHPAPCPAAAPDPALGARILAATVRITAYCGSAGQRVASGFVWGNSRQVVTDLHEVIGCDRLDLRYNTPGGARLVQNARVARVLVAADLALLAVDNAPDVAPLTDAERPLLPGETVTAWGYPLGIIAPLDTPLQTAFANELYPELRTTLDDTAREDLATLHFPSLAAHVLHLIGPLQPGDSGAPIVDQAGQVVGIGSGGLRQGAASIAWAIRSEYLAALAGSADQPPDQGRAATLFAYESVHEATPGLAAPASVRCGDLSLTHAGERSLKALLATAENRNRMPALARLLGVDLAALGEEVYGLWSELRSGAVVVLPPGTSLVADAGFCTLAGIDPALGEAVRVYRLADAADTPEWEFALARERWRSNLQIASLAGSAMGRLPSVPGWSEHRIANGAEIIRTARSGAAFGHPLVLVYKSDFAGRGATVSISVANRQNSAGQDARARAQWVRMVLADALAAFPGTDASAPQTVAVADEEEDGAAPDDASDVKPGPRFYRRIHCGQGNLIQLSRVYRIRELAAALPDPPQFTRDLQAMTGVQPDAIAGAQFDVWGYGLGDEIAVVPRGAVPAPAATSALAGVPPGCIFTLSDRPDQSWLVFAFHSLAFPAAEKAFRAMMEAGWGVTLAAPEAMPAAVPPGFSRLARWRIDGHDSANRPVRAFVAGVQREQSMLFEATEGPVGPAPANRLAAADVAPILLAPAPAR